MLLPLEDDEPEKHYLADKEHNPPKQMCENAFLRILERFVDPNDPNTVTDYTALQVTPLKSVDGSARYSCIRLEPRLIFTVTQLVEYQDCEEQHEEALDTFWLPSLEERSNVRVGTAVKCIYTQENEQARGRARGCGCGW